MKPTLVDNCEHYNYQTHNCNKCGRGLPDVCLEFENMKKAAAAYNEANSKKDARPTVGSDGPDSFTTDDTVASADASAPKRRGRKPKEAAE